MNYPNVPIAPGVPSIPRDPLATLATVFAPVLAGFFGNFTIQWGVFDSTGNLALNPDSIISFENTSETNISDFPVEKGSFGTINKVIMPVRLELRCTIGGNEGKRSAFENTVRAMKQDTNLYTIHTPENLYVNMNLMTYDVRRTASSGVSLITYNLKFKEVREVTLATGTSAVPAASQTTPTTSTGTINATNAPPQAQAMVKSGITQPVDLGLTINTGPW